MSDVLDLGKDIYQWVAYDTRGSDKGPRTKENKKRDAAGEATKAEAEAQVKQLEFEASTAEGLARLSAKRKRGFLESIIATPPSTLGSAGSTLGA